MSRMHLLVEEQKQSAKKWSEVNPTINATDDVENKVDGIITTPTYFDTNSPYNQTLRWSDNCVTDLNGTVFMNNGIWDMIPCTNC